MILQIKSKYKIPATQLQGDSKFEHKNKAEQTSDNKRLFSDDNSFKITCWVGKKYTMENPISS